MKTDFQIEQDASTLLQKAKCASLTSLQPIPAGRNNRVFKITCGDGAHFLYKCYLDHPGDTRDRLGHEFAFLEHLNRLGCTLAAAPVARDVENKAGLMEFLQGRRIELDEVNADYIREAARFYLEANAVPGCAATDEMATASEASFSIAQHVEKTSVRVDRLHQIEAGDDISAEAVQFVRREVIPIWCEVLETIFYSTDSVARLWEITEDERCLSPSDFGFHNALMDVDGNLRFVDFEYAGWDDPAKLVCDFCNQPDMLLPRELSGIFRDQVVRHNARPADLEQRIELLEPLYQIKWVCICLNDFLRSGHVRRKFIGGEKVDHYARKISQLATARRMLSRVGTSAARSHQSPKKISA